MILKSLLSLLRKANYFFYLNYSFTITRLGLRRTREIGVDTIEKWKIIIKSFRNLPFLTNSAIHNDNIISKAEEVLNHQFTILGKEYFIQKQDIDWHFDPSSGLDLPGNIWHRSFRKQIPKSLDVKYPWELSRCQHFILLGQAYQITKDEKYAREYTNQIEDWIKKNPLNYGVNWTCTMEVAIRVSNWLISLIYFIDSQHIDNLFLKKLLGSVFDHGYYIRNNLENLQIYNSNHYVSNITGLFILSLMIPSHRKKGKWLKFSLAELEREIVNQIYSDGFQNEASTSYHRLVIELFFFSYCVGKESGILFSRKYIAQLTKMIAVLNTITKNSGDIPQIGDNDSGRFLVFNHQVSFGNLNVEYFNNYLRNYPELAIANNRQFFHSFEDSGRYLWRDESIYLILNAGPKGQGGNGGHAHNDILSYELSVNGDDLVVDPGTYCYTSNSELRNKFRSVQNHSTLCWDGIEPCSLNTGLFRLPEEGILSVKTNKPNKTTSEVNGLYKFRNRFHNRIIQVDKLKRTIKIIDKCSHQNAYLNLILSPNVKINIEPGRVKLNNTWIDYQGIDSIDILPTYYSPEYGVKVQTNKIQLHLKDLVATQLIHY